MVNAPPRTNRYFVTPDGSKGPAVLQAGGARLPTPMAMFTATDAVLPFHAAELRTVDSQLDLLIYDAFPLPKAS